MNRQFKHQHWLGPSIFVVTTLTGIFTLLYPFLLPALIQASPAGQARLAEMPLMITMLLGLCLVVLLYEVQSQAVDAKLIALLGVLVAINSILRFIEIGIPGPGGFSPVFFLIILTGYVFGGRFGFLMGVMTMFASAIITGGVGPWLPGQMFAAGWVGLSAVLIRFPIRIFRWENKRFEIIALVVFGILWGFLYGIIMNLWTWPFISGPANRYWTAGIDPLDTIHRYMTYYLLTSLVWDSALAGGNALLLVIFGPAALRALQRFKRRFSFVYLSEGTGISPSYRKSPSFTYSENAPQISSSGLDSWSPAPVSIPTVEGAALFADDPTGGQH